MKRSLPFIIIAVVLVGGLVTFFALSRKRGGNTNNTFVGAAPQPPATNTTSSPPQASQASSTNSAGLTKPNVKISSPVLLEAYGDYQCPPCGALYPDLKKIEAEYGSQVRFVFHYFPLSKIHKNAMAAARAAEAARLQNKFWQMHDRLYRNQKEWSEVEDPRPIFNSYARELGLNADQFRSDMDSNRVEQAIDADMQRGQSVGITGTPTVLIEGYQLRYEATNLDGIRRGLNVMLERKAVS